MSERRNVRIATLPSGVPKLDDVLGGGIPEYSFNLIVGDPGTGKTTLAHQIVFANASAERPVIYFTILGEPSLKMLRYQQQFSFFDLDKVNRVIHFVNLSEEAQNGNLQAVLDSIVREVERINPGIVVVDSFRSLTRAASSGEAAAMDLPTFVQRLAMHLTSWQATTFLIGEYPGSDMSESPVATVADGVLWLTQSVFHNSMVRRLQVLKMRGLGPQSGLHTVRIGDEGVRVFPRKLKSIEESTSDVPRRLISTGVPGLDELLGGGTLAGNALLVAGASGTGKTTLCLQFIAEGARHGEAGVVAIFEETAPKYVAQAQGFGVDLERMRREGQFELVSIRPLDLSMDETLYAIQEAVDRVGATRVVIDSISGLEAALAPNFKEDFRESLYRLLGALTGVGITVMLSVEVTENYNELRFTPHTMSFLTHDIILQRYVEIDGQLRTVMAVVKTRGRGHSRDVRPYEVTERGLVVGDGLNRYRGIITGVPEPRESAPDRANSGLTDQEMLVMTALVEARKAPVEDLARRTGLRRGVLARALNRIVALEYARKATEEGRAVYRAARTNSGDEDTLETKEDR
jgi:circadian clock protein KaiC